MTYLNFNVYNEYNIIMPMQDKGKEAKPQCTICMEKDAKVH